ncbi:MAG: hypothetical protein AAGA48_03400 [Myxococcota bacterium]
MIGLAAAALAGPPTTELDVPFPATRVYPNEPDRVCLVFQLDAEPTQSHTQMPDFDVECTVENGWMTVCLTLGQPEWPDKPPPIECGPEGGVVRMRPVRAYVPDENIWDGVALLERVDIYKAVFRVNLQQASLSQNQNRRKQRLRESDHPDVPGLMFRGECGIRNGLFWFETEMPSKKQTCILVMEDGSERTVPIRLVRRLRSEKD